MLNIKLLDCTLRDGGYLVDAEFGDTTIKGIICGLLESNIDIIECGFLKNEEHKLGTTIYNNISQVKEYLPKDTKKASFVLLADYSRYSISNLENYDGGAIDGIRACFFKDERYEVIDFCREIVKKGYKLYVQPVDILGYSDKELIEFIEMVNPLEPYAFSIVDTFGSMYKSDLQRVFYLINNNLTKTSSIGFHSHNNLQMSFALSQEFVEFSQGLRNVIIDSTICGLGRGAGNTNTELMLQYMNKKFNANYDIDIILDLIDNYIESIKARCEWGYSIPYYLAGSYSAHVNNISYLIKKASISSKDMRFILNKIGSTNRKRYDYNLLEKTYVEYVNTFKDDSKEKHILKQIFMGRDILIILPGKTLVTFESVILKYINEYNPIVISVNIIIDKYKIDYIYFSNRQRYNYWKHDSRYKRYKKIITSNISKNTIEDEISVDFGKLVKCGWEQLDNSGILLLRLLDLFNVNSIALAGFDGYNNAYYDNYARQELERKLDFISSENANRELLSMLEEYKATRQSKCKISFITPSKFQEVFK
ncbi:aldolase catalytic domain-containing protein [Candidatus Clostridium helianthi]|uniref:Aldolase catalytic domain-containing protein n=1 Tax=Candidatus Clostridium helianthi TaxID=3381660 RepID=A0ABW8S4A1_9CLOT